MDHTIKYDQIIEAVGPRGCFQKRLFILLFLASVPNGMTTLLTVFTQYTPPHHCKIWPDNTTIDGVKMEAMKNLLIPKKEDVYDTCSMYNVSFDRIMELLHSENMNTTDRTFHNSSTINCPNGYYYERVYPNAESAVTEFDMVCEKAWLKPVMTSLFMAGMGAGSLSGKLSDVFGRRVLFLIFTYSNFVAVGLNGVAWNLWSYGIFMFIGGVSQLVNFVVAFILSCEFMNVDDRNAMSLGPFIAFSTGYTLSALMGYLFVNWRWLLIANALIGILFIPYFWLIPESPRWLMTKGRMEEAQKILESVAKMNGRKVDVKQFMNMEILMGEKNSEIDRAQHDETLFRLLRRKVLRNRFFICCSAWFVTSLIYYTISLNTSGLAGNRFINCLLAALIEIPAYILGFLCVRYCGRPLAQSVLLAAAGVCCTIAPFLSPIHPTLTVVVAMIGKFAITAEFFIVYIYFAELSPTLLRNLCLGLGSFSARVSGFIAPYLIYAGENLNESIPFLMMGFIALVTVFFTVLCLPETRGVPLPDNCEDALQNERYLRLWSNKSTKPNLTKPELKSEEI